MCRISLWQERERMGEDGKRWKEIKEKGRRRRDGQGLRRV